MNRTINAAQVGVLRVVRVEVTFVRVVLPVAGVVECRDQTHAAILNGSRQFAGYVYLGALVGRIPLRKVTVPHGKAVMMLGAGTGEPGAGLLEKFRPVVRIEFVAGELGQEVLVAELLGRSEVLGVPAVEILVTKSVLHVHPVGIPFGNMCRNRVDSPVRVNPELAVLKPIRDRIRCERFPGRLVGFLCSNLGEGTQ